MKGTLATVVAIMTGLAAGTAFAQGGTPFNPLKSLKLSNEDMAAAGAAADRLYEAGAVGEVAAWSNDASGNSGRVKLLEMFQYEGYDCREVEHVIKTKGNLDPNTLVIRSCLADDGTWKFI
jgi:surface antigen